MRAKWYVVAWRLLWLAPAYAAMALAAFFILLGWGPSQAKRLWHAML